MVTQGEAIADNEGREFPFWGLGSKVKAGVSQPVSLDAPSYTIAKATPSFPSTLVSLCNVLPDAFLYG